MPYAPSLELQQALNHLQQKRLAGELDAIEYSKQADDLIANEVNKQQNVILEFAIQEMRASEQNKMQQLEEDKKREEEERRKTEQKREDDRINKQINEQKDKAYKDRQKQSNDETKRNNERKQKELSRKDYRENQVPKEITRLKEQYQSTQKRYTTLQIISVCASIVAASMVGLDVLPRWVVALFSAAAAIATGLLSTFKIRERNYSYYQAISSMEAECHNYDQRIEKYADIDDDQAFKRFSSRISEIKQQYASQELSFWKAEDKSDVDKTSPQPPPSPIEETSQKPEAVANKEQDAQTQSTDEKQPQSTEQRKDSTQTEQTGL